MSDAKVGREPTREELVSWVDEVKWFRLLTPEDRANFASIRIRLTDPPRVTMEELHRACGAKRVWDAGNQSSIVVSVAALLRSRGVVVDDDARCHKCGERHEVKR